MKHFKKILFLATVALLIDLVSCCPCDEPVKRYSNTSLALINLDNTGAQPAEATSDTINKQAYGVRVLVERKQVSCIQAPTTFFIQTASAFTCRCKEYTATDNITDVNIYTLADFDSVHAAGSDISSYFTGYTEDGYVDVLKYIQSVDYGRYDILVPLGFDMVLLHAPTINTTHRFRVKITLSDGRELGQETTSIELI